MTPEQLIADLQKHIVKLQEELSESQEHLKDFERLAVTWKKAYSDLETKHKREIGNLNQIVQELDEELSELKSECGDDHPSEFD